MDTPERTPKEPVTIRLDVPAKLKLQSLAEEEGRTVSSLIDLAVREFLDRRSGGGEVQPPLRVRHAALVDTSVLRAFQTLASPDHKEALRKLNLPELKFVDERPEWRRLPGDVFTGESDLVESVNLLPIFWHIKRGEGSPRLDWVGPFLQLFVGHHIFVRKDVAIGYLSRKDVVDFEAFRARATTGRELSLRSLVGWLGQSRLPSETSDPENTGECERRKNAVSALWADSVVGCQIGTDYHIAVRRLSSILANLLERQPPKEPSVSGLDNLTRGFLDFRNGTITAFTGGLLHSAELLANEKDLAYLIAGPADLRVPSLNTLAGQKGMFEGAPGADGPAVDSLGAKVLELWHVAVTWFRDEIVGSESNEKLRQFVVNDFPEFLRNSDEDDRFLLVLKSLMQSWVKWFADREEARAFLGDGASGAPPGNPTAADLVQHYERLGDLLNPSVEMSAPDYDDEQERAFWRFPVLTDRARQFPHSSEAQTARESRPGQSPVSGAQRPSGRDRNG